MTTSLVTSYAWGSTSGPPVNTCWDLSTTEFPAQLVVATSLVINGKSLVKSWGDSKFFPNKRRKKITSNDFGVHVRRLFSAPPPNPNSSSVKSIGVPHTLVGWHPNSDAPRVLPSHLIHHKHLAPKIMCKLFQ